MAGEVRPTLLIDRSPLRAARVFNSDRLRWLDEAASLGPLVRVPFGPVLSLWVLSDPDAARDVLIGSAGDWRRPPPLMTALRVAGGENLFTIADQAWAKLQPSLSPAFHKRALEPRLRCVPAIVGDQVQALPRETTVDLDLEMARLTIIVASWVLFGIEVDRDRAGELALHQRAAINWVGDRIGSVFAAVPVAAGRRGREMREHRRAILDYAKEILDTHRSVSSAKVDLLDALVSAQPNGRRLSETELQTHVAGFFTAGTETTAAAIGWAIVHGAANPSEWARLREDPGAAVAYTAETLRLSPSAWAIPRAPRKRGVTLTVGGSTTVIPRRQSISIYVRGINRDPNTWPNPMTFSPSRHAAPTVSQQRALIPFGLGPRGCIGQHLALAEIEAALPLLARHGDITVEGQPVEDPHFALRVRDGLRGWFSQADRATQPSDTSLGTPREVT